MGEAVHETSAAIWDFLMNLNARSFVNVANAGRPAHAGAGPRQDYAFGAAAALKGAGHMSAYYTSKSALLRLTEAISAELKDQKL